MEEEKDNVPDPHMLMEEILDHLKLLDYEASFCRQKYAHALPHLA